MQTHVLQAVLMTNVCFGTPDSVIQPALLGHILSASVIGRVGVNHHIVKVPHIFLGIDILLENAQYL